MKNKIKIIQNGDGKESVYGEEEPTTNYIKSDTFETIRKYFTYFFIHLFFVLF